MVVGTNGALKRLRGSSGLLLGAVLIAAAWILVVAPSVRAASLPTVISENTTLTAANSPYTGTSTTVNAGVTLNVEPGVMVKLTGSLVVNGTLKAEGTAEAPILFTSSQNTAPSQWQGITFSASGSGKVDHAEVRYAGSGNFSGAIKTVGSSPTITNSTICDNGTRAIHVTGGGAPEIAENTIVDNAKSGIYFQEASGKTGEVRIHDNLIEGSESYGIWVETYNNSVVGETIGGNTLKENAGGAIAYEGGDLPPDLDENTLIGNGSGNRFYVRGTVSQSTAWTDHGQWFSIGEDDLKVASGATLVLGPGLELKTNLQAISVTGTLKAEGTAEAPILFTSSQDTAPTQWKGIIFNAGSSGAIDHAEVRYAGSGSFSGAIKTNASSPTITNSTIRDNGTRAIHVTGGGAPEIADNAIVDNAKSGIYFQEASGKTGEVRIHDNLIEGSESYGIWVETHNNSVVGGTLGGNVIKDNNGGAIAYEGGDLPPDLDENTFIGNGGGNRFYVRGTVSQSTAWTDHGQWFLIDVSDLTIASGTSLTLGPGLELKSDFRAIRINGTLKAEGTAESPILFTSFEDTAPAQWQGIVFNAGSSGVIDHAEVRYAGSGSSTAAIRTLDSSPVITSSTIRDNGEEAGISMEGGSPQVIGNALYNNERGVVASENGSPEIAENTIKDCTGNGISQTIDSNKTGEVRIHDNLIERCGKAGGAQIYVFANDFGSKLTGVTLEGNTLIDGGGRAIDYYTSDLDDIVPPDIDDNTLSGNASNAIWVAGKLTQSATWTNRGFPIVPRGGFDFKIAGEATLTLDPGLVLKPSGARIRVEGELIAEGAKENPITITSVKDDSIGGDTNQDGAATFPAPGDYIGFRFAGGTAQSPPGRGDLDYVHARFGGWAGSCGICGGGGPTLEFNGPNKEGPTSARSTVRHSLFRFSDRPAIEVDKDVPGEALPEISWNRFSGNGAAISKSSGSILYAPHNDFGCLSGPKPRGCGDEIRGQVNASPYLASADANGRCRGKKTDCPEGADPVSLATGELSYSHRDLYLSNRSDHPLEVSRSYASGSTLDAGLGLGWSHIGLSFATELESGAVLVVRSDGRQDLFQPTESGYQAPPGVTDILAEVEGTLQLTTLEGTVYRFGASGRIASITDDHGLKTIYGYDANSRLATITDPSSQTLTFSYDASNHISAVQDSTGREVKYTYSGAGDLATVTDALGGVTEYTYDSAHRLKTIKDPRGNVILKNTYDGQGRVIEQLDGLENLWTLEYKEGETVVTEPEGGEITYGFDSQGRITSEKDQLGHTTTTSYDEAGNVDEIVKPGGSKWTFGHDVAGNLTSVIDPEEGERSYEYDGLNRLTSFTDEREETWSFEWDEDNDLVEVTDPAEGETTFTHDAAGLPLTVTDPNEHTTTFTYDARGNRITAKDALEHTTTFAYNARNQLTSKTEPGLKAEIYGRNALGELLSLATPEGHKTEYAYDGNGMLTQVKDPAEAVWEIERNAMGRPTAYVDPHEEKIEIAYDGNLNRIALTDRRGKKTTYAYDLANRLAEVVRPEGGDWEFDYDARGNRIEVVEPRENATTYEYDLLDQMTESAEPLGAVTSYEYDPAGNLIAFTDPRENTTDFIYDEMGRVAEIEQPLEKTTTFTYDGVGNRLTRTTAEGTLNFDYDAANRLQEITEGEYVLGAFNYDAANRMTGATDAQSDEIETGYDDDGRLVSIDDGRGQTVSREYDSRGNVIKQTDGRGVLEYGYSTLNRMTSLVDPQGKEATFGYDSEGNLTEVDLPNGVLTTNSYDDVGRLSKTSAKAEGAVLQSFEYGYDAFGNRTSQVDRLSQETTYAYDALNRLTQFDPPGEGSTGYSYDAAGNRTEADSVTYGFNALNQLTSASDGTTYDYDDAGRLVEVDYGEHSTTYTWSPLDELTAVDDEAQEVLYTYDALGRQATRDGGSSERSTHYGDLSDLPILDTDAEGQPTMSYVQGPGGLVEQRTGEATSYSLPDAHGDVTGLVNEVGEVVSRQAWDPWGDQLSGSSLEMGWLGAQQRRNDPATGLIQMGVRSYAPTIGSLLSEDPVLGHLGIGVSMNRYPYAWDNPCLYFDLMGQDVIDELGNAWDATGGEAWDATADGRDFVGVAGDGNGGWLSESPGFLSDRATDLLKEINFSTEEFIAALGTTFGEAGMCGIAGIGAGVVGTPAAGLWANRFCVTLEAMGAFQTVSDIFDDDNEIWTEELFR